MTGTVFNFNDTDKILGCASIEHSFLASKLPAHCNKVLYLYMCKKIAKSYAYHSYKILLT